MKYEIDDAEMNMILEGMQAMIVARVQLANDLKKQYDEQKKNKEIDNGKDTL